MELYDNLGVGQGATADEIKKAFREKSKQHHPDKGGDAQEFHAVARAYDVLGDAEKRARYDKGENEDAINGKAPTDETEARDVILTTFAKVIGQGDVRYEDLVGKMRSTFKQARSGFEADIELAKRAIAATDEVLKRIRCKGERNLLASVTEQRKRELEGQVAAAERGIRIFALALQMLDDYEYQFDERQNDRIQIPLPQSFVRGQMGNIFFRVGGGQ